MSGSRCPVWASYFGKIAQKGRKKNILWFASILENKMVYFLSFRGRHSLHWRVTVFYFSSSPITMSWYCPFLAPKEVMQTLRRMRYFWKFIAIIPTHPIQCEISSMSSLGKKVINLGLSPTQKLFVLRGGWGGKKGKVRLEGMEEKTWKKGSRLFAFPIIHPALSVFFFWGGGGGGCFFFFFFMLLSFLEYPAAASAKERERTQRERESGEKLLV